MLFQKKVTAEGDPWQDLVPPVYRYNKAKISVMMLKLLKNEGSDPEDEGEKDTFERRNEGWKTYQTSECLPKLESILVFKK